MTPDELWASVFDAYADHLVAVVVVPVVLGVVYHVGFLRWRGATPGKLLCGLRVRPRTADGPLSLATIAARLVVQQGLGWLALALTVRPGSLGVVLVVYLCAFVFASVDALAALGQRRQTIHDRAAGTVVVKTR